MLSTSSHRLPPMQSQLPIYLNGWFRKLCETLNHKGGFANGWRLDNPFHYPFISLLIGRDNKFAATAFFSINSRLFRWIKVNSIIGRCTRLWSKLWGSIYCCSDFLFHQRLWPRGTSRVFHKLISGKINIGANLIILCFDIHWWLWWRDCTTGLPSIVPGTQGGKVSCQWQSEGHNLYNVPITRASMA